MGSAVRVSATAVLTSEPNSLIEAALALDPQEVKTRAASEITGKRILAGLCFIVLPSFGGSWKFYQRLSSMSLDLCRLWE